jgi:hypothetical protein
MRFILHDVFQVPARYASLPGLAGAFDDGIAELATARLHFERLLPRIHSLAAAVRTGSASLRLDASSF